MAVKTKNGELLKGLKTKHDTATGNMLEIIIDCSNPAITQIPDGVGKRQDSESIILNCLVDILVDQLSGKLEDGTSPISLDVNPNIFGEGTKERVVGTDEEGKQITELHAYKVCKVSQFYKVDKNELFKATNTVNQAID